METLLKLISVAKQDGAVLAAIVAGTVAVFLAIVNPFTSWLVSRSSSLREIRARNREVWIGSFRDDASELATLVQNLERLNIGGEKYQDKRLRKDELATRLKLRLNPNEHEEFEATIDEFAGHYPTDTEDAQKQRRSKFINRAQIILKAEWDKVRDGK
jgi:hypothetical protein